MDTQVIVVGAGPVGLLLAGELRLGGADVVVVERLSRPTGESRAQQLNARTMEIFDQRGLLERMDTTRREDTGHFGGLALDVSKIPSAHQGFRKVPQPTTEAVLQEWAADLGADIRRGHELRGLTARPGRVEVDVAGPAGPVRLATRYVVGCDGEQSTVRELAGIPLTGTDASRELFRADVDGIDIRPRRFERLERGLAIAGRPSGDLTRIMLHEFGRPVSPRTGPPSFAEVAGAWERITGEDISTGTPIWIDAFGDVSRQAQRYREGRILLAGDAAHRQMPVGGQALNLGLQDAANLGWKLAAQVRGWAPAGLLDSYHDERHPVGARILANIRAQTLLLLGGPEVAAVRGVFDELFALDDVTAHLAAAVSGLDIRYPVGPGEQPLLGARIPRCEVVTDTGPSSAAALLRQGRGLFLDLSGKPADHDGLQAVAASWRDRIRVVAAKPQPDNPMADIGAVLVRPDGHIAWIDDGETELTTALHRWFGAPATN